MGLKDFFRRILFQTNVEKIEKEFDIYKIKDSLVYHDIAIRVPKPEEAKRYIVDTLLSFGYKVDLNEFTKFEELGELEPVFSVGTSKPVKVLIRGIKKVSLGLKYPTLFGLTLILSITLGIIWWLEEIGSIQGPKDVVFYLFVILAATTIALGFLKDIRRLFVRVKILGIYDVEKGWMDTRIIIGGNLDKFNENLKEKLSEEVSTIYSILSRKFTRIEKENLSYSVKSSFDLPKILNRIKEIEDALMKLELRYAKGEISPSEYNKIKNNLNLELTKLKTIEEMCIENL